MAFDKSVKDIKVQRGQNELCYGKVCTFQHRLKGSLSEGQNLKLPLRLGFVETDDHPHVSGIEKGNQLIGTKNDPFLARLFWGQPQGKVRGSATK